MERLILRLICAIFAMDRVGNGNVVGEIHTWFLAAVAHVFSHIIVYYMAIDRFTESVTETNNK